jgi:hypothetical protein
MNQVAQNELSADNTRKLNLGSSKVQLGGYHLEVGFHWPANTRPSHALRQHRIHRRRSAIWTCSDMGGCVRLRVEVHKANALSGTSNGCSKVDGSRGFAHAPLLIDDCNSAHATPPEKYLLERDHTHGGRLG